ncbi:hypothetical protein EYF80_058442 [Liparis tanakae]|uniref:Uncharacterized protein n=1 Tax=Liparis tanakae TaxID=230148 RepID=A0A4Z2ER61_9TELE|nr:hypothetical protein EYF80_058442 [Liparis tanakae]
MKAPGHLGQMADIHQRSGVESRGGGHKGLKPTDTDVPSGRFIYVMSPNIPSARPPRGRRGPEERRFSFVEFSALKTLRKTF